MLIFDHKKMDHLLRTALEAVGQTEELRSLEATIVVHPHDCDGGLCWELLCDPAKRPLVVLSLFPLALLEQRDKGITALLAQAGVSFTTLGVRLAAIVQAAERAKAKTEADPNAAALVAAFAAVYRPRAARAIAHDLAGAIMSGSADNIAALAGRANRLGITAANAGELLLALQQAAKENEEPTNAALDRLARH